MRRALPIMMVCAVLGAAAPAASAVDSTGTDFWLGFPAAQDPISGTPSHRLMVTAATAASGTVSVPGTVFSEGFTAGPGSVTSVELPASVELEAADAVTAGKGIHVTASQPVAVHALYQAAGEGLSDGYLGLPTDLLGTSYRVLDYPGNSDCGVAEFEIVGTQSGTTVTINPSAPIVGHSAGVPYQVALGAGSTYLGQAAGTSAGTAITADKPIAVLGGNSCAQVPVGTFAANFIVEQLPPTSAWGTDFSVLNFAARSSGDMVTVLGSSDGTDLSIEGAGGSPVGAPTSINAGQSVTFLIAEPIRIVAAAPILVAHFAQGQESESGNPGKTGDPTMILTPPRQRWAHSQTLSTPASGFAQGYLNIAIATSDLGSLRLDGAPVASMAFAPVGKDPTTSGARLPVSAGPHSLTAAGPFGVEVYGFEPFDAFGWPGAWGDGSRAPIVPPAPSGGSQVSATATAKCRVPKLRGKKLSAVRKALRRNGCRLGKVKKRKGATARNGKVVKQKPAAGKLLPAGAKVAITLDD